MINIEANGEKVSIGLVGEKYTVLAEAAAIIVSLVESVAGAAGEEEEVIFNTLTKTAEEVMNNKEEYCE